MIIETKKTTFEEMVGKPKPSDDPIQSLENQGTFMLGIDEYSDDEVVPLEVKQIKDVLRIIIKRTMKKKVT